MAAVALAFIMPGVLYADEPPPVSSFVFFAPISAGERPFIIVGAATAAVTEEVLSRGLP